MTTEAVGAAEQTDVTATDLGASSSEVGKVVRTIGTIASHTNLLARPAGAEHGLPSACGPR